MLPTQTLLCKSISSLSVCLTISVNSAYLSKCHNCKPNKCFTLSLSENPENISFHLTGGSSRKLATVVTERPANSFSGIITNISSNFESMSVHKLLDIIESSSLIKTSTSDNLFLKVILDLSFKPSNFVPALIPRPE